MTKIILPENHKRSVSSSFFLVEKLAHEIEAILDRGNTANFTNFNADIPLSRRQELSKQLEKIRDYLTFLENKYELSRQVVVESRHIAARKSKMWEVLSNTRPKHLKGFGQFPPALEPGFEQDLDGLIELVEKL